MNATAIALALLAVVIAWLTRKDQRKAMELVKRIEALVNRVNASVDAVRTKVNQEALQHAAAVQELRELLASGEFAQADVDAALAKLEASVSGMEGAVGSIDTIVADETPAEESSGNVIDTAAGGDADLD